MKKEIYESIINVYKASQRIKFDKMRETFVKFMIKRFIDADDSYIHITYAEEWVDRFLAQNPKDYMDAQSYAVYLEVSE